MSAQAVQVSYAIGNRRGEFLAAIFAKRGSRVLGWVPFPGGAKLYASKAQAARVLRDLGRSDAFAVEVSDLGGRWVVDWSGSQSKA
jgi:hypothetical protein